MITACISLKAPLIIREDYGTLSQLFRVLLLICFSPSFLLDVHTKEPKVLHTHACHRQSNPPSQNNQYGPESKL